jgi:hypothetical protein
MVHDLVDRPSFLLEQVGHHQVVAQVQARLPGIERPVAGLEFAQRVAQVDLARDVIRIAVVDPLRQP